MMATVLWIMATWLILGAAFTYALLTAAMRRADREQWADLDSELRELIEQNRG